MKRDPIRRAQGERGEQEHTTERARPSRISGAPEPAPQPARIGPYRVERKLGAGGMGEVLLARDELLERWVAVKVLLPHVANLPGVRERFRQEARAMARLRHPHVVGVHSFGEHEGQPYLAMEHVPGEPLHRVVARRGGPPLPVDEAIAVLDQIARGVSAIHAAGLVHRDLKPGNVLVGPSRRVAITDLGIAAAIRGDAPVDSDVWGTPCYSAPEVLDGTVLDPDLRARSDVFSLGVIAYELLTGRLPFESELALAMHAANDRAPELPSAIVPELPSALDAALLGAVEIVPERRTRSADAFRRALLDAVEAMPRDASPSRVMVVDDDPDYRALAVRALRAGVPGVCIDELPDGLSALEAIRAAPPDLVVSDLDMPGLDGSALIGELRRDDATRDIPVVVASACGSSHDWSLLCRLGADAFLEKPFEPQQLVIAVRAALSAARGDRAGSGPHRV